MTHWAQNRRTAKMAEDINTIHINDLPNEVLVIIYKKIPLENYHNLAKVCVLWEAIIHTSIGLAVRIGSPKLPRHFGGFGIFGGGEAIARKTVFVDMDSKVVSEMGISMCKFDEVRNMIVPAFKYPFLLKVLKFRRYISYGNFVRIMGQKLVRLQKLSISQTTLSVLEVGTVAMKEMPNLQKISVTGPKQRHHYYRNRSDLERHEAPLLIHNFMCLMAKNFNGLRCLKVQIPAVYHKDIKVMISILNFLAKHKRTLKRLTINYDEYHDFRVRHRSRPKLTDPPPNPDAEQRAFNFETIKVNNVLENLSVNFNQHATNHMSILVNGLRDMVGGYTALKTLEFKKALPVAPEINNMHLSVTLTKLQLDVKRGVANLQNFDLNLNILQHCCNLQKLKLVTSLRQARIYGGIHLPKSLEEISINQFKITTVDCAHIISELPKLQEMTFRHIGHTLESGFNQQDLLAQLTVRRFRKVYIVRGIIKAVAPLVIPPENPVASELHRLLLTSPLYLRIGWKAERGNYCTIRRDADSDLEMEEMNEMDQEDAEDDLDDFDEDEDEEEDPNELAAGGMAELVPFMIMGNIGAAAGADANDADMEE